MLLMTTALPRFLPVFLLTLLFPLVPGNNDTTTKRHSSQLFDSSQDLKTTFNGATSGALGQQTRDGSSEVLDRVLESLNVNDWSEISKIPKGTESLGGQLTFTGSNDFVPRREMHLLQTDSFNLCSGTFAIDGEADFNVSENEVLRELNEKIEPQTYKEIYAQWIHGGMSQYEIPCPVPLELQEIKQQPELYLTNKNTFQSSNLAVEPGRINVVTDFKDAKALKPQQVQETALIPKSSFIVSIAPLSITEDLQNLPQSCKQNSEHRGNYIIEGNWIQKESESRKDPRRSKNDRKNQWVGSKRSGKQSRKVENSPEGSSEGDLRFHSLPAWPLTQNNKGFSKPDRLISGNHELPDHKINLNYSVFDALCELDDSIKPTTFENAFVHWIKKRVKKRETPDLPTPRNLELKRPTLSITSSSTTSASGNSATLDFEKTKTVELEQPQESSLFPESPSVSSISSTNMRENSFNSAPSYQECSEHRTENDVSRNVNSCDGTFLINYGANSCNLEEVFRELDKAVQPQTYEEAYAYWTEAIEGENENPERLLELKTGSESSFAEKLTIQSSSMVNDTNGISVSMDSVKTGIVEPMHMPESFLVSESSCIPVISTRNTTKSMINSAQFSQGCTEHRGECSTEHENSEPSAREKRKRKVGSSPESLSEFSQFDGDLRQHQNEEGILRFTAAPSELHQESSHKSSRPASRTPIKCPHCNRLFVYPQALKKHCIGSHRQQDNLHPGTIQATKHSFSCSLPQCNSTFALKSTLLHHNRLHFRNGKLPCPVCPNYYLTKSSLLRHLLFHRDRWTTLCHLCLRLFATMDDLVEHNRLNHQYQCSWPNCTNAFMSERNLLYHLKTHKGQS